MDKLSIENIYILLAWFKTRSTPSLFKEHLDGLTPVEQAKADEWWSRMEKEGGIDRFNKEEQKSLRKYENYIDLETANYTDARDVGAEIEFKTFLNSNSSIKAFVVNVYHANDW